jgi:hypothetical protein
MGGALLYCGLCTERKGKQSKAKERRKVVTEIGGESGMRGRKLRAQLKLVRHAGF